MTQHVERKRTYGQWWDINEEYVTVPLEPVRKLLLFGLESGGATPDDAAFVLNVFMEKALQGDHTRGLRLVTSIITGARKGMVDVHPELRVVREKGATALVACGPKATPTLVCRFAMDLAIKKARQYGVGWVGAQSAGTFLTPYVKQAVSQGMIGMVLTQSHPLVAPLGGMTPLLGNAPIAVGVPGGENDPVILDMSITESSASGVGTSARQGQPVPEGVLLDEWGNPTTDGKALADPDWMKRGLLVARGSLRPLGGGHKGYALVFIVSLLSYLLTDSSPPWELATTPPAPGLPGAPTDLPDQGRYGTILIAIEPGAFAPADQIKSRVDGFIRKTKSDKKRPGVTEILYPGERSQQLQREGRQGGQLSIPASHYQGLKDLAKELGKEGVL